MCVLAEIAIWFWSARELANSVALGYQSGAVFNSKIKW